MCHGSTLLLSRCGTQDTFWHIGEASSGHRLWSDTRLFSRCRRECLVTEGAKSMRGACLHPCCYATIPFSVFLDNGFGILLETSLLESSKWRRTGKIEREEESVASKVLIPIQIHSVTSTWCLPWTLQPELPSTSQFKEASLLIIANTSHSARRVSSVVSL